MAKKKEIAQAFEGMFTQEPQEQTQEPTAKPKRAAGKAKAETTTKEPESQNKGEGAVFSVRISPDVWASWKAYNEAKDTSKGAIGKETEKAFTEYMKKHTLNADQTEDYNFYLKKYSKK